MSCAYLKLIKCVSVYFVYVAVSIWIWEGDSALATFYDEESSIVTLTQSFIFYGQGFQTAYVCYLIVIL